MIRILLIGLGGFLGSIFRYWVSSSVQKTMSPTWMPYDTMTVNILGCFLIGFLSGLASSRQFFTPEIRNLLIVGFLGGFTTFSTFGLDSFRLFREDQPLLAIGNILLQIFFGLGAVYLGFLLSEKVA